jgi:phage terminase Nu1 subunit (DNA packaging protein)
MLNPDSKVTQYVFAALVGLSQQAISEMVRDGVLPKNGTCRQWLHAYCGRLREQAAGRLGSAGEDEPGALDLVQERAALAREQRVGHEIKNAIARGEYAPIDLLAQVLSSASQAVVDRFEMLPSELRKVCPDLPAEAHTKIGAVLASARNEWVRQTEKLVVEKFGLEDAEE